MRRARQQSLPGHALLEARRNRAVGEEGAVLPIVIVQAQVEPFLRVPRRPAAPAEGHVQPLVDAALAEKELLYRSMSAPPWQERRDAGGDQQEQRPKLKFHH